MAFSWGESWDLYAAGGDIVNGYWDSSIGTLSSLSFTTGRFTGSQALVSGVGISVAKSSGSNDAVHHLVVAFRQTAALSGTTLGTYLELFDATTAQCSIVFRSDGAILLTSGAPNSGTTLATYTGAVSVINTWYAFEFEVVINNTTGSFKARRDGNTSNDFSATSLDTQNSANAYANKLQFGMNSNVAQQQTDDLFWRSDSSVAWMGDIRCWTRMPASDSSVTFSRTSTGTLTQTVPSVANSNTGIANNTARFTQFTAAYSGTVTGVSVSVNTGNSGNAKCAIYADNGSGLPGAVLASATASVTPVPTGTMPFTFSGVSVTKGVNYWAAVMADTSTGLWTDFTTSLAIGATASASYSTFPQSNPVATSPQFAVQFSWTYASTPANWQAVTEAQQDTTTSYVYDSTVNDTDFYGIAPTSSTPTSVIAVTTRAYMQKSDAGSRTAAVQLKSGATTVASPTITLTTSGWLWAWRTDITDPNTSSAWLPANVDSVTCGPKVIS